MKYWKLHALIGLVLILAAASLCLLVWLVFIYQPPAKLIQNPPNDPPAAAPKLPEKANLAASYLIAGDVFWGRGIDYYAKQTAEGFNWPFSGLGGFHPEKHQGWIADMECPITNQAVPYQTQVKSLIFSCSPDYLEAASQYFDVFTLANNHTDNTGASGFADTRKFLDQAGRQYFGHYDISQAADLCEIISLKAVAGSKTVHLPVVMCGYHWLTRVPGDAELDQINRYAKYFPVWVFPHGGTEYAIRSNSAQQSLYRQMIDRGASLVIGDHPHTVQETEAYKGRLIAYSVGNLVFDQWFDEEVTKSLIVNVRLAAAIDKNLAGHLKIAHSCTKFKDDCLSRAKKLGLRPPKLKYSYRIMSGDSSNASIDARLKRPGSPETYDWLLKRTGWAETIKGLKR